MKQIRLLAVFFLALTCSAAASAVRVPVEHFFKDAEFSNVSLSPTGEYITVSVPQSGRTLLAAFRVSDMSLVGKWDYGDRKHIDRVLWVNDHRFLMFVTLKVGEFDSRVGNPDVYATDVDGKKRIDIPNGGYYQVSDMLWDDPDNILVSRSVDSAFLYKLNVNTGKLSTQATAPLRSGGFVVDHDGNLRYAVGQNENNVRQLLRRNGDDWDVLERAEMGESIRYPLGFNSDNSKVYFSVSDQGEPRRISLIDLETNEAQDLSNNGNVDPDRMIWSADERDLLMASYPDGIPNYDFINTEHAESKAYAGLIKAFPNHVVSFRGISRDGRYILLTAYSDTDPGSYYLFDRQQLSAKFLLSGRSWINPEQMSRVLPIPVKARDGEMLHGYLTIPRFSSGKNLPLILHPHGGPHGPRDQWGFNPEVQFLANRGYAVLQINFRGSGGYGEQFEASGYRKWGTAMIDDMTDAVDWTIAQGYADPDRICTYGASYGGYAALQTVVREPNKYKCTIGYVGVYSLPLMFKDGDIPESKSGRNFLNRVQPESEAEQQAQSPAYNIDRINIPVMLVQGAKDERVPISQYDLLKDRLTAAGKPPEVTVVEKKEGHGFSDPENKVALYTKMEAFLDKYIGEGRKPN